MTIDDTQNPDERLGRHAFTEERRAAIVALVNERGRVRTAELATLLDVTEPTVRRDVADLDRQKLLRRTHGGAIAVPAYEPELATRAGRNIAAKLSIARACTELIDDGDSIFLDSGSTVEAVADALLAVVRDSAPRVRRLNVLTNAVGVAMRLADAPGVRTTTLGGQLRTLGGCFVGPLAVDNLAQFAVNTAFIGVSGLADGAFSVSDPGDAQLKSAVMQRAQRIIVPMDSSKAGITDFQRVCRIGQVDILVTESQQAVISEACSLGGVELIVAP